MASGLIRERVGKRLHLRQIRTGRGGQSRVLGDIGPVGGRHIRLITRKTSRLGRTLAQTFLARRSNQ